jgi:hypothetical protein
MLRADVIVHGEGEIALAAAAGGDAFAARLQPGSAHGTLEHNGRTAASIDASGLLPDRPTRLEWVLADHQVCLALDGRTLIEYRYQPAAGTATKQASKLAIGANGADVEIHHPRVLRDVYYTASGQGPSTWKLGRDEYLLLGDNSWHSRDSRSWSAEGGVSGTLIVGKAIWW